MYTLLPGLVCAAVRGRCCGYCELVQRRSVGKRNCNVAKTASLAYEPPEGRKERPTLHYSVERHLILNSINTSLIWTYPQVVMSGVESVVRCFYRAMWRRGLPLSKPFDLTVLPHPVNRVTINIASAVRVRTCTYGIA